MTDSCTLRRATPDDAEHVATISVRAWRHAYEPFLDARLLAERTVVSQVPRWRGWLEGAQWETRVAEVEGRIAGYVTTGLSADADADTHVGELRALYVDPAAQGAGLGSLMLDDALTRLRAGGFTEATLWVFAENGLGRAFYERHGWTLDPSGAGQEGAGWEAPAVRYRLRLGA